MTRHQASGLLDAATVSSRESEHPFGQPRPGRVLGIISGKGGVGKSALAVNLATAASMAGARVLLIDGDLGLANTDLLMGLIPSRDLEDWEAGRASLVETICRGPSGLQVLVSGNGQRVADRICAAVARPGEGDLAELIDSQDLTILDLGAGIGDRVLRLASACDLVWLVVTPEPTSLADAYATAKLLWKGSPHHRLELVINRVHDVAMGQRTHQALGRLMQRFLSRVLPLRAVLPEDAAMARSVARQSPLVIEEPRSPAARRLRMLAESLIEEASRDRLSEGASPRSGQLLTTAGRTRPSPSVGTKTTATPFAS